MAGNLEDILKHGDCIPEELLLNYMDKKLPAHEMHLVEKHLLDCEFCTDALEGLRILQSGRSKEIISDLNSRIDARSASLKNGGARIIPFRKYYPIAAVIALFILFGGAYMYLQNKNEEKTIAQNASSPEVTMMDSVPTQIGPAQANEEKAAEQVSPGPHFSTGKDAGSTTIQQETKTLITSDKSKRDDGDINEVTNISTTAEELAKSEASESKTTAAEPPMNATGAMDKKNPEVAGKPTVAEQEVIVEQKSQARQNITYKADAFQRDSLNPEALFQTGNANYDQKKYLEATPYFEQLATDSSSKYYDDAKWLLANCYMRIHKNVKAKKLLKEISNSNSMHNKKAHGLLQEMQ